MTKTPKSSAEIQTEEALNHIDTMISKQNVKIEDAQYLSRMVTKVLYKCEELRKSRDNHRKRRILIEEKLKEIKLKYESKK